MYIRVKKKLLIAKDRFKKQTKNWLKKTAFNLKYVYKNSWAHNYDTSYDFTG